MYNLDEAFRLVFDDSKLSNDKLGKLRLLIDGGADINRSFYKGYTMLMKTVVMCQYEVELLVCKNGSTELMKFFKMSQKQLTKKKQEFEKKKRELERNANEVDTALLHAPKHFQVLKLLLDHGVDINDRNSEGFTILNYLPRDFGMSKWYFEMFKWFFENGGDIHAKGHFGQTFLIQVSDCNLEFVQFLLDHGADINDRDDYGDTALIRASNAGHKKIVDLLLNKGADANAQNKYGDTALMFATSVVNEEIVHLLLDKGAEVNLKNKDDHTALMFASSAGNEKIVYLLLEKGAEVNAKNKDGDTALMRASSAGNE